MAELRYKFMKIIKELGIKTEKKLTLHTKNELEDIIIKYNKQKWSVNKISSIYKKYRCKKMEAIDKNELKGLKNRIKQLEMEKFKLNKEIEDLKYTNKCKQQEISRILSKNISSNESNSDDSDNIKREISYSRIPEMSIYRMKKYLQDKNIEVDNNCLTHVLKQTINRCNNNKYKRLFKIGVLN